MSFVFIEFIVCLPALYVNIGLVFLYSYLAKSGGIYPFFADFFTYKR